MSFTVIGCAIAGFLVGLGAAIQKSHDVRRQQIGLTLIIAAIGIVVLFTSAEMKVEHKKTRELLEQLQKTSQPLKEGK